MKDGCQVRGTIGAGFQINQETPHIHRHVLAIDAYKRRDAGDVRVFKNFRPKGLLTVLHAFKRNRLRHDRDTLHDAGILSWKEAFRDRIGESTRQNDCSQRNQKRQPAKTKHNIKPTAIKRDHAVDPALGCVGQPSPKAVACRRSVRIRQHPCAHHRDQCNGHDGGDDDGDRQRHGEFVEQSSYDILHEQQRD